jgi:hypothetical protein
MIVNYDRNVQFIVQATDQIELQGQSQINKLGYFTTKKRKCQCILIFDFQAICSRRSTDTAEDFVEGLRHFDKGPVL